MRSLRRPLTWIHDLMSGELQRGSLNTVIHILAAVLQTFKAAFMQSVSLAAAPGPDISYCTPLQQKRASIGR